MSAASLRTGLCAVLAFLALWGVARAQEKTKTPKPLGAGVELRRDAATGELRLRHKGPTAAEAEAERSKDATLRVGVNLVEVNCNVLLAEGQHLRGLGRDEFRVWEDGAEQVIAHFDASQEPASIALVMDASPSVTREMEEMKAAARTLAAEVSSVDEIAVVTFDAEAYLLLPFSRDRVALERAIESASMGRARAGKKGSNIYEAVFLTAQQVFRGRTGRKAMLLLTDGQDSGLGLSWAPESATPQVTRGADRLSFEDVVRALAATGVEVHIIATQPRPKALTEEWLRAHGETPLVTDEARKLGVPHYTAYLAELVRRVGGRIYFLRELGTLSETYKWIALNLRAQYTLGYYPAAGMTRAGWRRVRVEVPGRVNVRVTHRAAYYVPSAK